MKYYPITCPFEGSKCSNCYFYKPHVLAKHIYKDHPNQEKTYLCPRKKCGIYFHTAELLKLHCLLHEFELDCNRDDRCRETECFFSDQLSHGVEDYIKHKFLTRNWMERRRCC